MNGTDVAIVIPTFNEAENLPELIRSLEEILPRDGLRLIIIDDNSPDGTADAAESLNSVYGNIFVQRRTGKLGIGSAVLAGLRIAVSAPDTEFVVTMDADLSHDPQEVLRLLSEARGTDLVQGSRYIEGGKIVGWGFYRRFVSWAANRLYRFLFRTKLHEHTTYYRVYSRQCAQAIVSELKCFGFEFAIASILFCRDRGYRIKEVPITFSDRAKGTSKLRVSDVAQGLSFLSKTLLSRSLRRFHSQGSR